MQQHSQETTAIAAQLHQQSGNIPGQNAPTQMAAGAPNSPGSADATARTQISGGRFDFEDGGTYCGGWEEGKAHGHGVCTGPRHQGAYSGAWNYGFEVSGVYIWPSGSSFEGQWQNGRRHGLGVETRGRWIYRGEWSSGSKGRYGVRQSATSTAKYEGTWAGGLQDGYGAETYADGGSYQGQWQEGKRHGYGVRTSAPFGLASHYRPKTIQTSMSSLRSNDGGIPDPAEKRNHRMDDVRGGFVLKAKSDEPPVRRNSLVEKTKRGLLSLKKQRSAGDLEKRGTIASGSIRSTVSTASWRSTGSSQSAMSNKSINTDSNASFTVDEAHLDPSVTEVFMGEWKRDKRDGYGISERSDGLKYEGEWHNNKKHGYGVTTFRDGTKEEGKYKCNVLITSQKKKHLFLIRSAKFRERIEAAVSSSQRASKYALQKADIAISRQSTAKGKAELADTIADNAKMDSEIAVATAREFAPDFKPSVLERFERIRLRERFRPPPAVEPTSNASGLGQLSNFHNNRINTTNYPNNRFDPQVNLSPVTHQQRQINPGAQQSINRGSMLLKQASVDYTNTNIRQFPPSNPSQMENHLNAIPKPNQQMQMNSSYQLASQYNTTRDATNQMYNNSFIRNIQQPQHLNQHNLHTMQHQQQQQQQSYQLMSDQLLNQQELQQQTNMYQTQNIMFNQDDHLKYSNGKPNHNISMLNQDLKTSVQNTDQIHQYNDITNIRRGSRYIPDLESTNPTVYSMPASAIDHFDHYKRPPSRDSSVDRYARATNRLTGSRQSSVDRSVAINQVISNTTATTATSIVPPITDQIDRNIRAGSAFRSTTPGGVSGGVTVNGAVLTGTGASRSNTPIYQLPSIQPVYSSTSQPFEDVLLRQRTLGQDIIPSPREPKRTESLYLPQKLMPTGSGGRMVESGGNSKSKLKSVPIALPLLRKKSLPHVQELPKATDPMSREEVSALGSARREEVRRQIENSERLKANPLLYLVSPQVKDWFTRQQLVMLVLLINIALAVMFFKILT